MSDLPPPPGFIPPTGPPPPPPQYAAAPERKNRTVIWVGVIAFLAGLVLGVAASGGASEPSDTDSSASKATTTTEAERTTEPKRTTTTERTTTTTEAPTTTTAPPYTPKPEDFQIGIVETERECFGDAGCNISYRIDVKYTGQVADPDATYTVIYNVLGGETVETKNFTISDAQISYSEDYISTPPNPTLSAVATQVLVD